MKKFLLYAAVMVVSVSQARDCNIANEIFCLLDTYIDKKTAEILETISEKNGVSFTDIANDILTRFVTKGKK